MKKITLLILMSLLPLIGLAQFTENFDTGFPPTGWTVYDNNVGTVQDWGSTTAPTAVYGGTGRSAFVQTEDLGTGEIAQDWLVTNLKTVPTDGKLIFWMRQLIVGNQGSKFKIMFSPSSQTDISSFVLIGQFTEDELNSTNNSQYFEHSVDFPAIYHNTTGYIAFVREIPNEPSNPVGVQDGDRLLLDQINLTQGCKAPQVLNARNITTNSALLFWQNTAGAGATQYELTVINETDSNTVVLPPTLITPGADALNPPLGVMYQLNSLLPAKSYKYILRTFCTNGVYSNPVELSFFTKALGTSCAEPIPVTTIPYSHTSNTVLYSDAIDGSPGSSCGITGSYLNGHEVIYKYTADFTGNVIITMTPGGGATNTGMFVYSSCANITNNCMAGVANAGSGVREIMPFAVTNGTSYYIVLSSNGTPQTFDYTLIIQKLNCLPPTSPQVTATTQTSATLTWGGTSVNGWEYIIQSPTATFPPTGSGIPVASGGLPVTDNTLTHSTQYVFTVRAVCPDGVTYSPWTAPVAFTTQCGTVTTFPYTEGFNSTSATEFCWSKFNGNADANQWDMNYTTNAFEGDQCASIVSSNATNNDFLISPKFNFTGTQRLRFKYRAESGANHNFQVKYSTASTSAADFNANPVLSSITATNTTYLEKVINLNTINVPAHISFHVPPGANGARIYIDQVILEEIPQCSNPTDLAVGSIGSNSAVITWNPGFNETSWQVQVVSPGASPGLPTDGVTVNGTPTYTPALNSSTSYDVYVLANCGIDGTSSWVGPIRFTTLQVPGTIAYVDTFESNPEWTLNSGTVAQTNKWIIGSAVNNGGAKSLYITNDNGATNAYTLGAATVSHAYRDIVIPAGTTNLNLGFDWRAEGESTNDLLKVYLVPNSFVPQSGTAIVPSVPLNRIKLGGDLNRTSFFTRQNITVNGALFAGTTARLVFEWINDNGGGSQPPAAVDNINFSVLSCPAPSVLSATVSSSTSAVLDWTNGGSEGSWEVVIQPVNTGYPTASSAILPVGAHPYTTPTLNDSTTYEYYVRAVCGTGNESIWVGPFVFSTQQIPATLNYVDDFENPIKWTFLNGTQTNKWVVGTAVNNGGSKSLYISNTNAASNNYSLTSATTAHVYRDIQIPSTAALLTLSFDWRANGETSVDYLRAWLVPVTYTPTPGTLITTGGGRINITGNLFGTTAFQSENNMIPTAGFAGQTMRLVFEWRNDGANGNQPPAAIDNVNLSVVTCPPPTALAVQTTSATSATLTWTPVGPATQWEVYAVPFDGATVPGPLTTPTHTVNGIPAQITGLIPGTRYIFYVRSVCSSTDTGPWTETTGEFYTKPINDECVDAILVPVNPDMHCTQVTAGTLTYATASSQPAASGTQCTGTDDDDVWFQFVATNNYLQVSLQDIVGTSSDLVMSVYSGSCSGPMSVVECINDNSDVLNGLTVGQTYYIRVYSTEATPQTVTFNLCITTPSTCGNASSICTVTPYTYVNTTGVDSQGSVGCLGSTPNPTYFTIQIAQTGPINLEIGQYSANGSVTNPDLDVDYALWGPYTSQSAACATGIPNIPPVHTNNNNGSQTDYGCSYLPDFVEQLNIPFAQQGQIYILLVTNFSDDPGHITISQLNNNAPGAGQTLCCPDPYFKYDPVTYCTNGATNPVAIINAGSVAGTFSCVNSTALVFANTATGEINLAATPPGTYLIKNDTTGAAGACAGREAYFTVIINAPYSASIAYSATSYCKSDGLQSVTITGDQGGNFGIANGQVGLSINTDTGQINPALSQPGTYTVEYYFVGNNNCTSAPIRTTVTINASPTMAPVVTQANCTVPTGTITLTANSNYEYSIDNGTTFGSSNVFSGLNPGTTYQVAIRDITNGCISTTSVILNPIPNNPPAPTASLTHPATCSGTGTINVTGPTSGPSVYTNLFISEVTDSDVSGSSLTYIEIFNGTGAPVNLSGYKLQVYNNGNTTPSTNCDFALSNFTLPNNGKWVVKISTSPNLGGVVPHQTVSPCAGINENDNIRLVTSTGTLIDEWGVRTGVAFTPNGQPGYTYRRLNTVVAPSTTFNPLDWQVLDPEDYSDLRQFTTSAGVNYQYSIDGTTFGTGTVFTGLNPGNYTVTVQNPTTGCKSTLAVVINPAPGAPVAPTAAQTVAPICSSPTGEIGITNPTGATLEYSVDGVTYQSGLTFSNLTPGTTYNVSVRDTATGCISASTQVTIDPLPAAPADPTATQTIAPTCTTPTGTLVVSNPTGATLEYSVDGISYQASATFGGLVPGNYNVTVRDINTGCVSNAATVTIDALPAAPTAPTVLVTVQATCVLPTGTMVVQTPAESTGFEYAVDGGTYQASATFTGLAQGNHTVIVKELATGCESATTPFTIDSPVLPNAPILDAAATVHATCNVPTGTIVVQTPAESTGFEYAVDGGTYQASATFTGLAQGNHTVTVKELASGCESTATAFTIDAPVVPTTPLLDTAATIQPTCAVVTGTIVVLTPAQGSGFEYAVDGGAFQTSSTFAGLALGAHTVTVRDIATGCISAASAPVTLVTPVPVNAPSLSITVEPTCDVPTGTVTVTSPIGSGYEYSIDNGVTYQSSPSFATIAAGASYSIIVRDILTQCVSTATTGTMDNLPPADVITIDGGCLNGSYTLTTTTTAQGTYAWFNLSAPGVVLGTNSSYVVTTPGTYGVELTTSGGCISSDDFSVSDISCEIPKGISPNGDTKNDAFDLTTLNVKELKIFNRYGRHVYQH
ncbi:choice-of-anchor J domain-containing protein, partial [Flavobacterium sp. SM15]|uniref:choice-of-anchor J domain-containing protein n=1 Tax=Flavobacterium sp. SM15 TaxID=2908005 RepID=UPI001EDC8313